MMEGIRGVNQQSSIGNRQLLWLSGLFVLLVLAVYADPLFFRRNFAGRDQMAYHYPLEKAIHDAYARGRLPVWVSEISGGRPLLANPNVGALYPVRPLFSPFSFPFAVRIFPVLHWMISGVGIFLLLNLLDVSSAAAWVGVVTYVFSGVSVSYVSYPNTHPGMALLPWIVWALARPASSSGRGVVPLSIVWGLVLLSGDIFVVVLGLLTSLLWLLLENPTNERPLGLLRLAGGLVLAGLAAAPQIVASALWIPETTRAVSGLTLRKVLLFSVSPFRLLELLIPFPFGNVWNLDRTESWGAPLYHDMQLGYFTSFYAGAFAAISIVLTWRSRARGARFGRWLIAAVLVFSVPPSLFPSSWGGLQSPVPLRYPEKFVVALVFALSILAALGFDAWRKPRRTLTGLVGIGAAFALVAAASAFLPGPFGRAAVRLIGADAKLAATAGRLLPGAFAEAGLLWIATVIALEAANRDTRRSLLASLALLTLVPIAANRKIALTFPEGHLFAPSPLDRYVMRVDPGGEFRMLDEQNYTAPSSLKELDALTDVSDASYTRRSWYYYTHALWGRGTVFNLDFDSGDLSRLESLRHLSFLAGQFRDPQAFFGSLSLRWGVRLRDQPALAGYNRLRGDSFVDWDENESANSDVRLLRRWREETGALPALNRLRSLTAGEVVLESGVQRTGSARPGSLRVLEKTPERLVAEVETPDPTWLFVLRAYWTYRTILLDGRPVEDVPAQLAFSAVHIPPGRHRVDWREEIPGVSVSRWGPVIFLIVAVVFVSRRGSGKQDDPSSISGARRLSMK